MDAMLKATSKKLLCLVLAFALMACGVGVAAPIRAAEAFTAQDSSTLDTLYISGTRNYSDAQEVLAIVNTERAKAGLSPLAMDGDLLEAAMLRAAETNLDFSHTRPDGTPWYTVLSSKAFGENIAAGRPFAADTMSDWMDSAGHKANIMGAGFTTIGIGSFTQGGIKFWVQLFGSGSAAVTSDTSSKASKAVTEEVKATASNNQFTLNVSSKAIKASESFLVGINVTNPGWTYASAKVDTNSYKWSSSNTAVATVLDGKVVGIKDGVATITCASKSNSAIKKTVSVVVSTSKPEANAPAAIVNNTALKTLVKITAPAKKTIKKKRTATIKLTTYKNATVKSVKLDKAGKKLKLKITKGKNSIKIKAGSKKGKAKLAITLTNGNKKTITVTIK